MIQRWYKLLVNLTILVAGGILITVLSFAAPNTEGIQVYQKSMALSPEHKQNLAEAISRYRNADNLWDVLREEFTLTHYENTPAVEAKIEWFMNNQDYLLRSASRAAPYLYYILQQVKKRHLPAELVLLPIIESGYNPFSLSNVGAAGIWQLMPDTASGLGVKRDSWYDGRRDVIASTRAALNYLAYLQSFFEGNWLLAIAAYNTGEGNVLSAIKKNIRDGRSTVFWSLPLAQQTKDYVPSLLALATIISHPDQYPIYFPPVRNAPYLAQVDVGTQINLKYAASIAGISYRKMQQLNPGFNHQFTSKKGPYKLILPIENVEQFTENLTRSPLNSQSINWVHYKIKSGDSLASISKKFVTTASAIRKLNHLGKHSLRQGADLLIPRNSSLPMADESNMELANEENVSNHSATVTEKNSSLTSAQVTNKYLLQPGDTIYMIRANDSWQKIAQHFHVSQQLLQAANQMKNAKLTPGKQLIIPTHAALVAHTSKLAPGDTIYMVRRGDTIEKIALKFRTTPSIIRLTNLVDNNSLTEGDKIIIPTHLRS